MYSIFVLLLILFYVKYIIQSNFTIQEKITKNKLPANTLYECVGTYMLVPETPKM